MIRIAVIVLAVALCIVGAAAGQDALPVPPGQAPPGMVPPPSSAALRILFIGNSITYGLQRGDFSGGFGMAASQADRDYVHRVQLMLAAHYGVVPEICVASLDLIYPQMFDRARQTAQACVADIVVIEAGDAAQHMSEAEYKRTLTDIAGWARPGARRIVTGVWYVARLEEYNRAVADSIGAAFVPLNDLHAPEHEQRMNCAGDPICTHPGDDGMAHIAERIVDAIIRWKVYLPWTPNESTHRSGYSTP